ncbi:hypothetical protein [Kitasatospora sp. NPDC090091]|uniref:hypothetical protein n=1 Tax=Kitasatospora sp. NPDC090091 TaxID=3364081 RepID=UPI00380143AB
MATILAPPADPTPAPPPASPLRTPADHFAAVPSISPVPGAAGLAGARPAAHVPAPNSHRPPPRTGARTTEAGDPVEALMWTLWLMGHVLVIALLGVLVSQELDHQDVALGQAPTRSVPDAGDT